MKTYEPGTILTPQGLPIHQGEKAMSLEDLGHWVTVASSGMTQTAYRKLTWVYACITKKATSMTQLGYKLVMDDDEEAEVESGLVYDLLQQPNPYFSMKDLAYQYSVWMDNAGEAHFYIFANASGTKPELLWTLDPTLLQEVVDETNGRLLHWLYTGLGGANVIMMVEEVISWRVFNPWQIYRGLSPLEAGRYTLLTEEASSRFNAKVFQNAGGIGGIYSTEQKLDKPTFDQMMELIKERHSGPDKAGLPLLMQRGTSFSNTSWSPRDIMIESLKRMTREEICGLFAVPPVLVGILDRATYGNFDQASKTFWQDVIMPRALDFSQRLTKQLCERFQPGTKIIVDTTGIEELAENTQLKLELAAAYQALGYPLNDINALLDLGMPDIEGGEKPHLPGSSGFSLPPLPGLTPGPGGDLEDDQEEEVMTDEEDEPVAEEEAEEEEEDDEETKAKGWPLKKTDRDAVWEAQVAPLERLGTAMEKATKDWYYGLRSAILENMALVLDKASPPVLTKNSDDVLDAAWAAVAPLYDSVAPYIQMSLATGAYQVAEEAPTTLELLTSLGLEEEIGAVTTQVMAERLMETLSPALSDYIANTQARLTQITLAPDSPLRASLGQAISEGLTAGDSFDLLSDRVKGVFSDGQIVNPMRIARTETGLAQGYSRQESLRRVGTEKQQWLTARDEAVREDHQAMDGVTVGLNEPFIFPDGSSVIYPREVGGEAHQVINCRCTTLGIFED